jgi:PadR family transcriptional regulator, regulatory protein AphA
MATVNPSPDSRDQPLTATGRVILGMLGLGKETGYDIKQLVDRSTRHFWAASYGQIYPELRRLEAAGLVSSQSEPSGARARTVYRLTDAGHAALDRWLASTQEPLYELRDEGMLKLFFSDLAGPDAGSPDALRIEHLRAMRARQEQKLQQLRAMEPKVRNGPPGTYLTLRLGIDMAEWFIEWSEAAERRLAANLEQE